ncbi:unnamed protein product [Didymodactylos carnosus]|uniref:Mitochondrial intermembrane space import and assembly protein 40 n=1 Tax=Didymodactylos carnosus TaxID=1234261 RepID=A0A813QG76_9BILA|nr:unnamed protein product [Didymodactylos carnosus]CAF1095411.1 unnamed protein product [Didymodactylos carnosus]CAF3548997.1 unnamed protein product [Didymodactylos carnosus]CAF3856839.1 unnamed protein product [Didymodactylos carnosus]
MSRITSYGKDKIIFADRDALIPREGDEYFKQQWIEVYNDSVSEGALLSNGNVEWSCPCLGTQAIGPCSGQFRNAFVCYQTSGKEPKVDYVMERWHVKMDLTEFWIMFYSIAGAECMNEFVKMQTCFTQYPKLYNKGDNIKTTKENEVAQTVMQHPEARRQRLQEEEKRRKNTDVLQNRFNPIRMLYQK